ncbi:uncharacterized protein [Venturia canescens]|uniref:uncharacterized protein n=1 Tax=Venturia canescens TaxID=32260 RepID=UPI001C9CCBC7|nr:uncharacterized protein LOC122405936 [Venturia canescens]
MHSGVNLVVILLTLGYLVNGLDSSHPEIWKSRTQDLLPLPSHLFGSGSRENISRKLKRPNSTKIHQSPDTNASSIRDKLISLNGTIKLHTNKEKNAVAIAKTNKLALIHDLNAKPKIHLERRDKKKKNKIKRSRVLMALLLAYKLKFAALIPTIVGGLALLVSTTALAGFFFALFAAVLGLKGH